MKEKSEFFEYTLFLRRCARVCEEGAKQYADMKLTEENEHPVDRARRRHPEIFTESTKDPTGDAFVEALSRWAREYPEEARAYEEMPRGKSYPMEILDHFDEIEARAKNYPNQDIVEVIEGWIRENPGVIPE